MSHDNEFNQYSADITNGDYEIRAEVYAQAGENRGLEDPNGITIVTGNGLYEAANTWRLLGRNIAHLAKAEGIAVNVVHYTDDPSYSQEEHTRSLDVITREVHRVVPAGHEVHALVHSRAGISLAEIGEELVEDEVITGAYLLASPVDGAPLSISGLTREMMKLPGQMMDPEAMQVYLAFATNILSHVGRDPLGMAAEVHGIVHSQTKEKQVALSGLIRTMALFCEHDGLVPGQKSADQLREAGFQGPVILMPGETHNSPLTNMSAAEMIICGLRSTRALAPAS
jgi:hypothetical protein